MLVWLNGAFGVGKSTTATAFVASTSGYRLFDPEYVGYMLSASLSGVEFSDFQDIAAWRQLVPIVARHVASESGQRLIAVQTVLAREYWLELRRGLEREGFDVWHVVLDADGDALADRIRSDVDEPGAAQWRLDHVDTYLDAKPWLIEAADLVIDVSAVSSVAAADRIVRSLGSRC